MPQTKIRVIPTEIGGGFGGKIAAVTEPAAILLAQKSGRPVKITYKRDEDFLSSTPRRPAVIELKTGIMKDGTLVARQAQAYYGNGAYHRHRLQLRRGYGGSSGGSLPGAARRYVCLYGLYQPAAVWGLPCPWQSADYLCGGIAHGYAGAHLGLDPLTIRKKNALKVGDRSIIGALDDAADLREMIERIEQESGWHKPKGKNRGRGIAVGFWASRMPGSNSLKLNPDGTVAITTGSVDLSGTHVTLQQIAGEELGVGLEKVGVLTGDTDVAPWHL